MTWATLKTSTLLMSAMIGEAVTVEYLRGLPADQREAAVERIRATFMASIKEYSQGTAADQKQAILHQMMVDEMGRTADAAIKQLVDKATANG